MAPEEGRNSIPFEPLRRAVARLFRAAGAGRRNALLVAEHLVDSSLRGVDSHGVMRVPQYLEAISRGEVVASSQPRVGRRHGSMIVIDGGRCLGPVGGEFAARLTASAAHRSSVALVVTRQMGHAGRIGAYTEKLAAAGLVGLAFCNSPRHGHFVAPHGASEGRLATNPIAFAFPAGREIVSADFATSAITEGAVRLLHARGADAPPETLIDAHGQAVRDPGVLYTEPRGSILPLGGQTSGYKGFALGLLVEILAGTLAGSAVEDSSLIGNNLTLIGVDPDAGPGRGQFSALAAGLIEYIRSARPINPARSVMAPGEREARTLEIRRKSGVPVDNYLIEVLLDWGMLLKCRLPELAAAGRGLVNASPL